MKQENLESQDSRADIDSRDKLASDIMILTKQYPVIYVNATIKEAISDLMNSYDGYISNKRLIYTVHRSMLVLDAQGEFAGILSVRNMIQALTPEKDLETDINHDFWNRSKTLAKRKVGEIMQRFVARVHETTKLTEVAKVMASHNTRRVVVVDNEGEVVGIVREQELFFEMANIIL
ncbi:CBS domain-containing protein [bacterium]|nr:CBS domain-containing protein [bacterium]